MKTWLVTTLKIFRPGRITLFALLAVMLSACLGGKAGDTEPQADAPQEALPIVRVYYGTDRAPADVQEREKEGEAEVFSSRRGQGMNYGFCDVVLPKEHRLGEIIRPSLWKLEFGEQLGKHVVFQDVAPLEKNQYFAKIKQRIDGQPRREVFIFVHGYNVSFAEAAFRSAQMAHDLKFQGAPILYTWPSLATLSGYPADEGTIEWTQPHLLTFIDDVRRRTGADVIHLIAHSLGNRAMTRAFLDLMQSLPEPEKAKFQNLILTAPDIDADIFQEQIAPRLVRTRTRVTLYVSANDEALSASRSFHEFPRVGLLLLGEPAPVLPGIETIDVSLVDTSFLGHSYFAEKRSVLEDMFHLLRNGLSARDRYGLKEQKSSQGVYWQMLEAGQ